MLILNYTRKALKHGQTIKIGDAIVTFKAGKGNGGCSGYSVLVDAPKDIKIERVKSD